MAGNPILFLDSGIGGIPYCFHFHKRNLGKGIVYLADRLHFPYGKRKRDELISIITDLAGKAATLFKPEIAVLACNTASVSALAELRERFPDLPFVGTVPAVKPATLASKTGKIGVLGTELTIGEPYIRGLAAENGGGEIVGIAAPELVEFIECRIYSASPDEKAQTVRAYVNRFRSAGVDVLVLGCTHFLFLLDEFKQAAAPDITVFDSVKGVTRRVESLLAESAPQGVTENGADTPAACRMFLTGSAAPEPSWLYWADRMGFSVSLLEAM
jgi:glutamate racemase